MKKLFLICVIIFLIPGLTVNCFAEQDNWRQEFDRICSFTVDAENLSVAELTKLIEDSDNLKSIIESKDDHDVKLYLIRIKKCRSFFVFMRDMRGGAADN